MKSQPILRFQDIAKRFPGVLALNGVNLELQEGEVHVLVGANGAGKSTLVKILAGVYQPDGGEIFLNGEPVVIRTPEQALEQGISIVYQSFNLIKKMDVAPTVMCDHIDMAREAVRMVVKEIKGELSPHCIIRLVTI